MSLRAAFWLSVMLMFGGAATILVFAAQYVSARRLAPVDLAPGASVRAMNRAG